MSGSTRVAMCSFQLVLVIDLFNHNNQFSLSFLSWFSYRQTPAVSDHFAVHQEWSLTRQLIIRTYGKAGIRNRKRSRNRNPNLRNKNWGRFCLESVTNNNCSIKTFHPHIIFIYCYYIFYSRIFCVRCKMFLREFHIRVSVATRDHD